MAKKYPRIDVRRTGQRIKQIMKSCGLTTRDIQEYLDLISIQSIYHWFDGRNLPSLDNLYALSELFHVPVDEMLCGNRRIEFSLYQYPYPGERLSIYYERYQPEGGA